ncbi:MAG: hypothetical protein IH971_09215, partial [Candidatus Marinimicrobia bacterium]|nr:hypothetical protein [Candidatus Neomarinimicrobiota bacterium]
DAHSFFHLDAPAASSPQIQAVYDQYDYDWQHWPAGEGAPFEDVDGDGQYDPAVDFPGVPGASQTIWLVANDLPNADGTHVSPAFAGAPPIGIEMQMTLYATQRWNLPAINKVIFSDVRLIYTGLPDTPDSAHIDTMYISQWADPDLGDFGDDLVGWDHNLDMGYVYDGSHSFVYPFSPELPAVGHVLLEGPKAGGDTLRATAFYGTWPIFTFGDIGEYVGSLQWFNLMEGFLSRPEYPTQLPYENLQGDPVKFNLDGDPVTGTGFLDGIQFSPGDRVYLISTGPFAMALGDTQEVTLALVGALGAGFPDNIVKLRESAVVAQIYNEDGLPPLDISGPQSTYFPEHYALSANYPNPFNPITRIDYQVPVVSILTLGVYNLLGQEIIRLVEQHAHPPGSFSVVWNGHSWKGQLVPAGVYFYRLEALPPY